MEKVNFSYGAIQQFVFYDDLGMLGSEVVFTPNAVINVL